MQDIDVVITWVDGNDPSHLEKRLNYSDAAGPTVHKIANVAERFESSDEVYFCIASILKYAPFVRNIFIVTDNQIPKKLKDFEAEGIVGPGKIRIIDHSQIFRDLTHYQPSFNSRSIEAALWRINGLAENFVYFNDDFFLNQPFVPENWFIGNKIVLRSKRQPLSHTTPKTKRRALLRRLTLRKPNDTPRFSKAQETAAITLGETNGFWELGHAPHPTHVSTLRNFHNNNPHSLENQIKYRFRDHKQYAPFGLAAHLEAHANNIHQIDPPRIAEIHAHDSERQQLEFLKDLEASAVPSGCIQDFTSLDSALQEKVYKIFATKFEGFLPSSVYFASKS
jgi:hypothetical protein